MTNVSWFAAQAYCKARGLTAADDRAVGIRACGRRPRRRTRCATRSLGWFAEPNGARPPAIGRVRSTAMASGTSSASSGNGRSTSTPMRRPPSCATPTARTAPPFCGGAAAGVADPTDYPAFMRYAMRASLKADYTADNLGFRCAGGVSMTNVSSALVSRCWPRSSRLGAALRTSHAHDAALDARRQSGARSIISNRSGRRRTARRSTLASLRRASRVVAAMGYTTCKDICPAIVADMIWIEKHLPPGAAGRVPLRFLQLRF